MKKFLFVLFVACLPLSTGHAREVSVTMHELTATGVGDAIGVIVVTETDNGLRMTPYLQNMQAGEFSFSINENVGCHSQLTGFDTYVPGMAAGHILWQMPNINVTSAGQAVPPVEITNVKFTDLSKRTLVISRATNPTLGPAGNMSERIACGSLEQY